MYLCNYIEPMFLWTLMQWCHSWHWDTRRCWWQCTYINCCFCFFATMTDCCFCFSFVFQSGCGATQGAISTSGILIACKGRLIFCVQCWHSGWLLFLYFFCSAGVQVALGCLASGLLAKVGWLLFCFFCATAVLNYCCCFSKYCFSFVILP